MIETKSMRNGEIDGKIVWICHYNRPDLSKKPLRNIPPTRVLVCSNSELPKNKRVYYSESHFRPINKDGKPTSRIISPVDNTGYRMYCGNELFVFENESDCIKCWNDQLKSHIELIQHKIDNAKSYWEGQKEELESNLK